MMRLQEGIQKLVKMGSICNAYLVEEASLFCSYYFEDHVTTRHRNVPRNYDGRGDVRDDHQDNLSIFKHVGRPLGKVSRRFLEDEEYNAAHIYVLLNCSEVEPYINLFVDQVKATHPNISIFEIDRKLDRDFTSWFAQYKSFYWDPAIDKQVYDKWMEKASERYRGLIYRIKRQRNQNRPPYIPGNIWPAWLAYWESEEVQEKARIAKKNRLTEPDGPGTGIAKHRGGSRCAQQHALALSKEKGIPINDIDWDLFMRFHFVNGEFTDPRSAKIAEEVHAIAKEQSQPLPRTTEPREVNMTAIYLDVVGVSKKNRVFGIGCRSRKYTKCGSRASSSQDLGVASEEKIKAAVDAQLQMRLDAQRAEMRQEIQAQMQAQVEAQVQSQVQVQLQAHLEEQKKVFEQMLAQFKSGSGHSPPS